MEHTWNQYNLFLHYQFLFVRPVSDPGQVTVNGVTIGFTSSDVLFHLGKEEISYPPRSGDRYAAMETYVAILLRKIVRGVARIVRDVVISVREGFKIVRDDRVPRGGQNWLEPDTGKAGYTAI